MSPNGLDISETPGADISAVLVHPHPGMGGDRFNHVIEALHLGLPAIGVSSVRFDLSSADPDRAASDTRSAIGAAPSEAVIAVGYSFGADVALGMCDDRVVGWAAIAPPLRFGEFASAAGDSRPKLLVVPEHDQFTPPKRVRECTSSWLSTQMVVIAGADHFMRDSAEGPEGASEQASQVALGAVVSWLASRALLQPRSSGRTMGK